MVSCNTSNSQLLGVVSDTYNVLGNASEENQDNPQYVAVGLLGQIRTQVNAENGSIQPGDFVTYSSVSGQAAKAIKAGPVIGRAIEGGTTGRINIYVNPTWYDPQVYLTTTGNLSVVDLNTDDSSYSFAHNYNLTDSENKVISRVGAFSEVATGKLNAGLVTSTQIETNALSIASENVTINGQTLKDYIASASAQTIANMSNNNNQIATNSAEINNNSVTSNALQINGNATISGTLSTGTLIATHIPALDDLTQRVTSLENQLASLSAAFIQSFTTATQSASFAPANSLDIKDATVSGDLMVLGRTTVSDLGVTGTINSGLLVVNGLDSSTGSEQAAVSINTLSGDLYLQNQGWGGIDILSGKVTIDKDGNVNIQSNLTAKEVTTEKLNILTDNNATSSATLAASAGVATIAQDTDNLTIETTAVTKDSLIYVTFNDDYSPAVRYWIENKVAGTSFTVKLDAAVSKDVKINWWIVN